MCTDVLGLLLTVLNLALGKAVFGSSTIPSRKATEGWENAVDGRTKVRDFNLIFHTGFELYPWLSIALGGVGLIKNITLYNRIDNYGNSLLFSQFLCFSNVIPFLKSVFPLIVAVLQMLAYMLHIYLEYRISLE